MIKKVLFSLCLIIITSLQVSAQKSSSKNTLSVKIDGGKSTVRAGQQVILKAIGFNEETAYLQWQVSTDGVAWQDIAKANGSNFETAPITESQFIRVVSRPNEGYLAIDDVSNAQIITLSENVASSKKKKQ
jgi:hypothetical protein